MPKLSEKIKRIAHTLGLTGTVTIRQESNTCCCLDLESDNIISVEGNQQSNSIDWLKSYFPHPLFIAEINYGSAPSLTEFAFVERILNFKHGGWLTIATGWRTHTFSISFMRDQERLRLIVLNKGSSFSDADGSKEQKQLTKSSNAYSFLFEDKFMAAKLARLYQTCSGQKLNTFCCKGLPSRTDETNQIRQNFTNFFPLMISLVTMMTN